MPDIFGIGAGLAQGFMNLGTSIFGNDMAAEREKEARKENYEYNEKAAASADARTRALFNDLYSIDAQMEQAKKAGLSPSMFASRLNGISGTSGAMGAGAAGISPTTFGLPPMDIASVLEKTANAEKARSEGKLAEERAAGQRIDNAGDPVLTRFESEKQSLINDANARETTEVNKAYDRLQNELTQLGFFSEGTTFSISRSHSDAEGESHGYAFNVQQESGETKSYSIGGSTSEDWSFGYSRGKSEGKSEGHHESTSEGHHEGSGHGESKQEAHNWAKSVAESSLTRKDKSGNTRETINALEVFYNQVSDILNSCEKARNDAREQYEFRVWRYEKQKSKKN